VAHEEPRTLLDRAAQAAMEAARETLAREGATLDQLFITLNASGQPGGEPNATSAADGEALPEDFGERSQMILAFLVGHAVEVGKQIGVTVLVAPIGHG
jgi:hypothetical protein